jgi:hypothetical protein
MTHEPFHELCHLHVNHGIIGIQHEKTYDSIT